MRLGILGGTFDPIHNGHLFIARLALLEAGLDGLVFLPDGDPPHKAPLAGGSHRLQMVRLAIGDSPAFTVSDMELVRRGKTYTVDTLLQLQAQRPGQQLHYIIGADTLFQFPSWKTAHKVASLCTMLVAPRPGIAKEALALAQRQLQADYGLQSQLLSQSGPDISSSQVRFMLRAHQHIGDLVPAAVADYIKAQGLYLQD